MSGGGAKPVDRHVVSLLNSAPCDSHLVVQLLRVQGDQVGVAEALGIELPARRDQTTDLCPAEASLGGWQPGELHVLIADPSEAAKHGQRLGVLRLIAVVEG